MSFLNYLTQNINPHKRNVNYNRKEEKDSLVNMKKISLIDHQKERASAFTSKGSLSLEAAIVVPIFFFAILCLAYLLEIMAIQTTMRNAIYSVGREVAQQVYADKLLTSRELERNIVEHVGTERLEQSVVAGGVDGIDCSESKYNWSTGVCNLSVRYRVQIPMLMFRIAPIACEETLRVKGWTGYVYTVGGASANDTVYVTDTGIVYHKDADCTYLDMSIRSVYMEDIEELRNQSGGKYYACESCGKKDSDSKLRYLTDYGTRFHTSLECKKIKRNIYAISLKEAYGLGGCSKCVK
ncbi:MAG: pilus assembly protein [Firmicutes bacterium]|nr:pilus assembly protein [Bacillota bacterium]